MVRRVLRAMVGLGTQPPTDEGLVFSLIENGSTETVAFGGWILAWAITGALLIVSSMLVHSSSLTVRRQVLIIAASLMATSVMGVILHGMRAAMAVTSSQKLAVKKRTASVYDHTVAWLTIPTPWVLVPQVLLGVAIGIFGASEAAYR